jgi:hypothetical protein
VPKLPWPPVAGALRDLRQDDDVVALAPMTALARVYRAAGRHPGSWDGFRTVGPVAAARFDTHPPTPDGSVAEAVGHDVLYAGLTLRTCVAESFQLTRVLDRRTDRPWLAIWRPECALRLLDLAGTWPTRAGASQAISSGPRAKSRAWARVIREAYPDLDGLWYRSSMDAGLPAVCLWTPARDAMPARPWAHLPLDAPGLALPLARAARDIGYRLL